MTLRKLLGKLFGRQKLRSWLSLRSAPAAAADPSEEAVRPEDILPEIVEVEGIEVFRYHGIDKYVTGSGAWSLLEKRGGPHLAGWIYELTGSCDLKGPVAGAVGGGKGGAACGEEVVIHLWDAACTFQINAEPPTGASSAREGYLGLELGLRGPLLETRGGGDGPDGEYSSDTWAAISRAVARFQSDVERPHRAHRGGR